ncbi:MAG: ABC transporter ATP-binding protein [Planctomycetaceae bacterium]|nr:ABC transporter ATP-binding protein [Planctomycetaceae bacterium]|tara:strand:- start:299 stop:2107 length:1809 start_codon:yes stop_codon:yes gene_type:complete
MSLLSLRGLQFTYGGDPLIDEIDLEIERGERIGLLGRNGTGKSTLMRLIAGELDADNGEVLRDANSTVARLVQDVPISGDASVREMIEQVAAESGESWQQEQAVSRILSRMTLDGTARFTSLSSGMKRRVLLARALVHEPDLLLLDEPTNHLDIESITWLEQFLSVYGGTLVFVTHDRMFLQALATRIIELDRGRLYDWPCDYPTFLKRREALLDAEEKQNNEFDRKLAEEERWIRTGIKARRTRNEGRVRALKRMRDEHKNRRHRIGDVRMQAIEAEKSGRLVIEATKINFAYETPEGPHPVVNDLSLLVSRGDRIGIIGPNGSGKTTLLKLLLGQLEPTTGSIRHGTRLQTIYFDQLREQIEEEKTVVENVGEGQETLEINGKPRNIYGYLQEFLFTPERARRPARYLSGGERNRLMLARILKRPSNIMVLDEPTNDLDAESLELLEELISNYPGTLLLVSHDRTFLNNLCTSTLVFEADGNLKEYAGGYDDYTRQRKQAEAVEDTSQTTEATDTPVASTPEKPETARRLSFREQQRADELFLEIGELEDEQQQLNQTMSDPEFFKGDGQEIATATARLADINQQLPERISEWEELESRR